MSVHKMKSGYVVGGATASATGSAASIDAPTP
jgi:hypothetical protein